MLGFAGTSYALFAAVWGVVCLLSSAIVTDAMLRSMPTPPSFDGDPPGSRASAEA